MSETRKWDTVPGNTIYVGPEYEDGGDVLWCNEKINDDWIEFVRAAEVERLRECLQEIADQEEYQLDAETLRKIREALAATGADAVKCELCGKRSSVECFDCQMPWCSLCGGHTNGLVDCGADAPRDEAGEEPGGRRCGDGYPRKPGDENPDNEVPDA